MIEVVAFCRLLPPSARDVNSMLLRVLIELETFPTKEDKTILRPGQLRAFALCEDSWNSWDSWNLVLYFSMKPARIELNVWPW